MGHSAVFGHALAVLVGASVTAIAAAGTVLSGILAVAVAALSASYAVHSAETFHLE